jgi:outer membrane protein OmpA-like peptidoglycan-associated protein
MVNVVEQKAREEKMVSVKASDMADAITSGGKIALYGIYFESGKADVQAASNDTLAEIAKLLKDKPSLNLLVVGHTDNAGPFANNMDLSQRRAAAVVAALTGTHGIKKGRLTPVGVSFAAPVASNKTEQGRAKNRRVELVEN